MRAAVLVVRPNAVGSRKGVGQVGDEGALRLRGRSLPVSEDGGPEGCRTQAQLKQRVRI